jgi:hypothetical protein
VTILLWLNISTSVVYLRPSNVSFKIAFGRKIGVIGHPNKPGWIFHPSKYVIEFPSWGTKIIPMFFLNLNLSTEKRAPGDSAFLIFFS